jgi:DNA mismatch repair protein MutS2
VQVLKRILAESGRDTLVLLDELGTGTDPEEGAALAMAMLDELVGRGVQAIVNTHLSPLKDYAARTAGVRNASMQFDRESLNPTYRLVIGVPGVSLGLTIAEKNGLPSELIGRAREHLAGLSETAPTRS